MKYSRERKEAVLKKMMPPHHRPIPQLAEDEGISAATLYLWRAQARTRGQLLPDSTTGPEGWRAREKFAAVVETAGLNEADRAEYCRTRGLYPEQLLAWRTACEHGEVGVGSCVVHHGCARLSRMARPLRLEYPGALYHVTARGNARQNIFLDAADRQRFLGVLGHVVDRFHLLLHAYCLMDNHFHLLVETPEGNLSKAMRQLNGVYTQAFNRRHERVGHVLQGRFKAILVDRESYLLELCRYVVLNPVRAKITRKPDTYPWSSYRATAGLVPTPPYLTIDWLLAQFGQQRAAAQRKYQAFVADGRDQGSPWEAVRGQVLLGSEQFVERLAPGLQDKRLLTEIPRRQRFAARPTLRQLVGARTRTDRARRNETLRRAHLEHGYSLSEIGRAVSLHYSTVSRIVSAQEREDAQNKI